MIDNEDDLTTSPRHGIALDAVRAGIRAAHPRRIVPERLSTADGLLSVDRANYDLSSYERIVVLGGGNGAGQVAAALEALLGDNIDEGIVVTDDPAETSTIEVREGTHPLPSTENRTATDDLLRLAGGLGENDLAIVVITGGGSALLCRPDPAVTLAAYRDLTESLVDSGATIDEINAVRKHLSAIKGGRLAVTLAPATVCTLVISDVVANRLDVVASGPTAPDPTTYAEALDVLERYEITAPESVRTLLQRGADGESAETPTESDPVFDAVHTHVLADNRTALDAAATVCADSGYDPLILSSRVEGEAREVGRVHAGIADEIMASETPLESPAAVLSGGEATVTVTGSGTGGPNQEFALATALGVASDDVLVTAIDTDGIDGATDAAGAVLDRGVVEDPGVARTALANNDVYPYLDERDCLLRTGHTGTNVNDLRLLLVG